MIREDLLNKIKEIYDIKEFIYIDTKTNVYSIGDPFLLFLTDKNLMAIRRNAIRNSVYHFETVVNDEERGYCYLCDDKNCILEVEENETVLTKISPKDTIEYRFPGKAFDFTKEFVMAALESTRKSKPRNGCC